MPVFNGADYLEEALDSILGQTFRDFELIISDNASTDATEEICRSYAENDARVTYIRNQSNIGAHPNYNQTFNGSSGKYFKWAPHDDILRPAFLERCVEALETDPSTVVCQTFLDYIDDDGNPIGIYDSCLEGSGSERAADRFGAVVLRGHPAYEVMGLFRRSALEGSLLLQSFHGADRALLAELALRGRFVQVSEPLLVVRDHKQRYTRSRVRPTDRAVWHDASLKGKLSFPTWRLYSEYWKMIGRWLSDAGDRWSCRRVLVRWWFRNFNWARMGTDVIAALVPDAVGFAERLKQRLFSPAPGADEIRLKTKEQTRVKSR
jgi:glycosyltransferase involved in cell wall biosynthesis